MAANGTLIEVPELQAAIDTGSGLFLFDCRFSLADARYGASAFADSHIPRAQFADLNQQLSASPVPGETGRHPLPDRESFLHQVQSWGVTPDAQVVTYDDDNGAFAARLWWMFRWLGHENVSVLDGGIAAWKEAGLTLTQETQQWDLSGYQTRTALTRLINTSEVLSQSGILADARDLPRFRGEVEPIDPIAGHIPGAICLPFADDLDKGRFKSRGELSQRFAQNGIERDSHVICYCGSGVTAAHNILALVHAGFSEPFLYAGSWSEWIADPERPVATGE